MFKYWDRIVGEGDMIVSKASAHALPWAHTEHNYTTTYPDMFGMHLVQNQSQVVFDAFINTIKTTTRMGDGRPDLESSSMGGMDTNTGVDTTDPVNLPTGNTPTPDVYEFARTEVLDMTGANQMVSKSVHIAESGEVSFLAFHGEEDLTVEVTAPGGVVFNRAYAQTHTEVEYVTSKFAGDGYVAMFDDIGGIDGDTGGDTGDTGGGSGTPMGLGFLTVISVQQAAPGTYQVRATAGTEPEGVDIVTMVKNPAVTISATLGGDQDSDYGASPGESLNAYIDAGTNVASGADITIDIVAPDGSVYTVTALDNGQGIDALSGDGIYSVQIPGIYTSLSGEYGALATLDGYFGVRRVTREKLMSFLIEAGL